MTLKLTPQLLALLGRVEDLVGPKSADALIYEALSFYEEILKRALVGKKLRLSFLAESAAGAATPDLSGSESVLSLERRMRLAAKVGLMPSQ